MVYLKISTLFCLTFFKFKGRNKLSYKSDDWVKIWCGVAKNTLYFFNVLERAGTLNQIRSFQVSLRRFMAGPKKFDPWECSPSLGLEILESVKKKKKAILSLICSAYNDT